MRITSWLVSSTLLMTFALATGCGEADDSEASSGGSSGGENYSSDDGSLMMPKTDSKRAVIELRLSGMNDDTDADDIRRALERVFDVDEAKVDLAKGEARILMNEDVGLDDLADAAKKLSDAVTDGVTVTGFSWEFQNSTQIKTGW